MLNTFVRSTTPFPFGTIISSNWISSFQHRVCLDLPYFVVSTLSLSRLAIFHRFSTATVSIYRIIVSALSLSRSTESSFQHWACLDLTNFYASALSTDFVYKIPIVDGAKPFKHQPSRMTKDKMEQSERELDELLTLSRRWLNFGCDFFYSSNQP